MRFVWGDERVQLECCLRRTMRERRFKKGDIVKYHAGTRMIQGVVKEDRGPLGLKGRHLYLVEFGPALYEDEPRYIELPAVELELVREKAAK